MKKIMRMLILNILTVVMLTTAVTPIFAKSSIVEKGDFGTNNFRWELDSEGTLTVSGKGAMMQEPGAVITVPVDLKEDVKKIIIEEGITQLSVGRFSNMKNATELYLPSTLRTIEQICFSGCTSLRKIYSKSNNLILSSGCFENCNAIEDFDDILHYATELRGNPFRKCDNLKKLTIPNNVRHIKYFTGADALKELVIEDNENLVIEEKAFSDCDNLEYLYLGKNMYLGKYAFSCDHLFDVEFADKNSLFWDYDDMCLEEYLFSGSPQAGETKESYEKYLKRYLMLRTDDEALAKYSDSRVVSEEDKKLAKEITAGIENDYDKVKAIYTWVCENMWYDYPTYKGIKVENPEPANGRRKGVCANYARLTRDLLRAVSIPVQTVIGRGRRESHAWNEAYVDGRWILLDATWDSNNAYTTEGYSKQEPASYDYFDCDIYSFSQSHQPSEYADPIRLAKFSRNNAKLVINGVERTVPAVMVFDNNYFRIRDVAYLLSNTDKAFEVGWDGDKSAIMLTSGKTYRPIGGELEDVIADEYEHAMQVEKITNGGNCFAVNKSCSKIVKDYRSVHFDIDGYELFGNNYFKLRDLGKMFDFYVGWDPSSGNVEIDTSRGYDAV